MTAHFYHLFGDRLRSGLAFPELRPAEPGPARWTFDVVEKLADRDGEVLGEELIYAEVRARLLRHEAGHRIEVDDTGRFDILPGGHVTWAPLGDPWWDFGRGHFLGRVMATVLHLEGLHTLHGSAVETPDGVVGFLAPKFTGKSTLALHLCREGAALVTDDSLPVEQRADGIYAHPGVHSIRVRSATEVDESVEPTGRDGKFRLTDIPAEHRMERPAPLSTLYILRSVMENPGNEAAVRTAIPGPLRAMRLLAHAKIGEMLGPSAAPVLFERAAALTRGVKVEELAVVRDRARLPEVVERILAWHGTGAGCGYRTSM